MAQQGLLLVYNFHWQDKEREAEKFLLPNHTNFLYDVSCDKKR